MGPFVWIPEFPTEAYDSISRRQLQKGSFCSMFNTNQFGHRPERQMALWKSRKTVYVFTRVCVCARDSLHRDAKGSFCINPLVHMSKDPLVSRCNEHCNTLQHKRILLYRDVTNLLHTHTHACTLILLSGFDDDARLHESLLQGEWRQWYVRERLVEFVIFT